MSCHLFTAFGLTSFLNVWFKVEDPKHHPGELGFLVKYQFLSFTSTTTELFLYHPAHMIIGVHFTLEILFYVKRE